MFSHIVNNKIGMRYLRTRDTGVGKPFVELVLSEISQYWRVYPKVFGLAVWSENCK
jgi:hypothetical protein